MPQNLLWKQVVFFHSKKVFNYFLLNHFYHSKEIKNYNRSIKLLNEYIKNDDFPIDAWHYLGLNYGKLKKLDFSSYAFAEKYLLANQLDNARIILIVPKRYRRILFYLINLVI